MNTVAVVGVGLIGASFGLALREAGFTGEILGVSSEPALRAGLRSGAISTSGTLEDAAARADLIYLAQPVDRILATLQDLGPLLSSPGLVTDAGSTKAAIVQKASACLPIGSFLGGHPMTGKEQRGAEAAEASLFRGRPYVLTPTAPESPAMQDFRSWLERMQVHLVELSAERHDQVVAFTSHLPQLLSTALAATLERQSDPYLAHVFGSGLLDMTRLAMSSPEVWRSVLETNKSVVPVTLQALIDTLVRLKTELTEGDPVGLFPDAGKFASRIRTRSSQ
jgi:prephenate dehydrogenase